MVEVDDRRRDGARRRCWRDPGRPRAAAAARHRRRGQLRRTPAPITGTPLRRRPGRCASARRSCWASAACARWPRSGLAPDRLPHERGPLRVPGAGAHAGADRGRRRRPAPRRAELVAASPVFTTHTPVPAGNEIFEPGPRPARTSSRLAAELGPQPGTTCCRPGGRTRTRATPSFGMTPARAAHLRLRQRREPRCTATSPATCGAGSGPSCPSTRCRSPRHQRRPPPAGSAARSRQLLDRYIGPAARAPEDRRSGKADTIPAGELWRVTSCAASAWCCSRAAPAPPAQPAGVAPHRRPRRRRRARSRRAHDRLRAPLRHLQARRPALPRPRAARAPAVSDERAAGADVVAGKAHPADGAGQGR